MNENFDQAAQQAAAFQKIWIETISKTMLAAFGNGSDAPPPEILRQIRTGIFQVLSESWDQFMRSPQFLESTRQWMENAVSFRRFTNDFMARARNDMQAPSRDDTDAVMLAVRHMEKRLLDRIDELSTRVALLSGHSIAKAPAGGVRPRRPAKSKPAKSKRVAAA